MVERNNRSLEELAKTMLNENLRPKYFWVDVINTSYILCCVLIIPILKKTPYELLKGGRLVITHPKVFGCKCFILNNGKQKPNKFDAKFDEEIFLGYAINSHAYKVYNKRLMIVEDSIQVVFHESNSKLQD